MSDSGLITNSANVYIKDLPNNFDAAMIKQTFGAYGNVLQSKVFPGVLPGQKTAALVRFENVAQAQWVISNIDGNIPHGLDEAVTIREAVKGRGKGDRDGGPYVRPGAGSNNGMLPAHERIPNDNLFVAGLPDGSDENFIRVIFQEYGTVSRVKMMKVVAGKAAAALVQFESLEAATAVQQSLHGVTPQGFPGPLQIMYAETAEQKERARLAGVPGVAPQRRGKNPSIGIEVIVQGFLDSGGLPGAMQSPMDVTSVLVGGLPSDCSDKHLYRIFSTFGAVQPKGISITHDGEGNCTGFGVVNYLERKVADTAVKTLDGTQLPDGSALQVSIKADHRSVMY